MNEQLTMTGSQAVVEVLQRQGVRRVFGIPGESMVGILDALVDTQIDLVTTRHEEGAAFAAEGHAKASGEVAVCFGARGVGATHLSIGIFTAFQDSTPMVALVGQVGGQVAHRDSFQEMDLAAFFRPITKWSVQIDRADRLPELLAKAFRIAQSGRPGPVMVALPDDVLHATFAPAFAPAQRSPVARPAAADVSAAVDLLLAAERPAILAGGGVLKSGATTSLVALAEALSAPVMAAWRRFDVFPNDHPLFCGSMTAGLGAGGVAPLAEADVLLAVGTRFAEQTTWNYRLPGPETALIHVSCDPQVVGCVGYPRVGMVADVELALQDLLTEIEARKAAVEPLRAQRAERLRERAAMLRSRFISWGTPRPQSDAAPVHPEGVIHDLQTQLPPEAAVVTDAGNFSGWMTRYYRFGQPGTHFGPITGGMGYGLPASLGIKLATPQRPVVCLAGDGGFMMTISELETAVRLQIPVVVIVFNNYLFGSIRMYQLGKSPERMVGSSLGNPNFAAVARDFGALGIRVERNADFPDALRTALDSARPALIELLTMPEELSAFRV